MNKIGVFFVALKGEIDGQRRRKKIMILKLRKFEIITAQIVDIEKKRDREKSH